MKKHYKKAEINLNKKKKKPSLWESTKDFFFTLIYEEKTLLLAISTALLFLVLLILESIHFSASLQNQTQVKKEKDRVYYQISFWQQVTRAHPDYRDAYFMIALLQYQLGDKVSSEGYLQKAMSIDPNFEKGKELQKVLTK